MLLDFISNKLLLNRQYITTVANSASRRYKEFVVPKSSGGNRTIHQPAKQLKAIQKCILYYFLDKLPVHERAYAYKKDSNISKHANEHRKNKYLVRIDFKDFFHSITRIDIERYCKDNSALLPDGWDDSDTELLAKLACRHGTLSIGAVTSPSLSNVICYQLDSKLYAYCEAHGINYSRYSDDIYCSTNTPNILFGITKEVGNIISSLAYPANLTININKTIHTSTKRQRKITGLILTDDGKVSIGRKRKEDIKAKIFNWDRLSREDKISLKGLLAFCVDIEPSYLNALCRKYTAEKIQEIQKYTA